MLSGWPRDAELTAGPGCTSEDRRLPSQISHRRLAGQRGAPASLPFLRSGPGPYCAAQLQYRLTSASLRYSLWLASGLEFAVGLLWNERKLRAGCGAATESY